MIVEVGGVRGVYEVFGAGPPVVLLASPVARAKTYHTTSEQLANSFRVFVVELPDSGLADRLVKGWSVEQYASWVAGFIEVLSLHRPVVIGHSYSAAIGVMLAARFPERVGQLVIADATGTGPHPVIRVFLGGLYDLALDYRLVLRAWHHVVGNFLFHTTNFCRLVRDCLRADVRGWATTVSAPVLIAWGSRDHTLPPSHAGEYARRLPNARLYLSPEGSHDWIISQAEEFADMVSTFIRSSNERC